MTRAYFVAAGRIWTSYFAIVEIPSRESWRKIKCITKTWTCLLVLDCLRDLCCRSFYRPRELRVTCWMTAGYMLRDPFIARDLWIETPTLPNSKVLSTHVFVISKCFLWTPPSNSWTLTIRVLNHYKIDGTSTPHSTKTFIKHLISKCLRRRAYRMRERITVENSLVCQRKYEIPLCTKTAVHSFSDLSFGVFGRLPNPSNIRFEVQF